ncbi:alpha/beta hydrolase [Cellulophaga sp. F20128]|uniref:alpha/beta hydrolase n=1 Tax=Cellulophaga sp. F20128 TaxID=2926413 RepID=UPI001FF49293|nr:alpha/beta hydrolase [Cellulophaga sp. F20128]MCK0156723.1 alpha/beta hydrolase [Cellulophaga sp. F20128]
MKKYTSSIIILFSIFWFSACTTDESTQAQTNLEYRAETNVKYGLDALQEYDIYLPKNRTLDTKTLILIHGGGWNSGSKNEMNAFKDFLREQLPDYAVVNMNYRLADANNTPYPMQINDIKAVVNHLKSNKSDYVISDKIGFIGASAGGHLALLYSYEQENANNIELVCSIVGPTNLADEAYINATDADLRAMLDQFGDDIDFLKEVSPLYQAKTSSPPTQLFYGGQDPLIPNSQGRDLNLKLKELNVPVEYTFYPNEAHGWIGLSLFDTSIKLKAFIQKHM